MKTILDRIVETKRRELETLQQHRPLEGLLRAAGQAEPPRDFLAAVTAASPPGINLIAEVKKASPSAGLIVADFDPGRIAREYHNHGAAAISVLTDQPYFQGDLRHIQMVKQAVPLPVLRKDFIIAPYQVYEARAAGADAILLIAEVLDPAAIAELQRLAGQFGMAALIEVHTASNLEAVLRVLGPPGEGRYVLGINNRDLTVQRTDLETTVRLAALLPEFTPFVAESGIATREDVLKVQGAGGRAILVGESLLRAENIGLKIDQLLGQ